MAALTPKVDASVRAALDTGAPVVAFETTVLSFGLPWPRNKQLAAACAAAARHAGAVPATLAVYDGEIRAGLTEEEIEFFCRERDRVTKVNLQNLAFALQTKAAGALTVAASMQACALAGIKVFATGGIGGVHRGYTESHDVSSDLLALARYPVAVVCSGVKSILDVRATVEQLETLGVPIIGYRADTFPLFHARASQCKLEMNYNDLDQLAEAVRLHWAAGGRGVLVLNPVPEKSSIPQGELEDWIADALKASRIGRVHGKAVTPFLLKRLEELSGGKTLEANIALLENNARVGGELAGLINKA